MVRNIIAIILLAGAIAIFFLYTKPAYDSLQTLSAQSAQYDAALGKATQLQTLKQSLLSRYNSFDPNALNRLSTMLPDQVDNIRLILDLDNLAGRSGMALQNVNISTPNSSQANSVVGSIASAAQPYDSLTLQFTTHGTYEQFTQFLAALQSSLRLVDLVTLNISGGSTPGTQDPQYTYTMTVQTYWLR
jgi:Tfp pilus assembly protein PilO